MGKEKLKFEHKPFHCPICGTRFMNFLGQPLPNHVQVEVKTSSGDDMSLALCQICASKGVTLEVLEGILEGIKDHWIFEIDEDTTLKAKDKKDRKDFHKSHFIGSVERVHNTGKDAQLEARKAGKLQDGEKKEKRKKK